MDINATVTRKSSIYSKSTDRIHLEQAAAAAEARRIRVMGWLLALLIPLIVGMVLTIYFYGGPEISFLK